MGRRDRRSDDYLVGFISITDADPTAATKDAEFPNGKDPSGSIAWEVTAAGTEIKVTNGNLNSWSSNTEAPMHFWKFYWKEASDGHQPYIPGLGLYEHDTHVDGKLNKARKKGTGHEKNLWISDNPLDPAIKFNAKKSAGTDCIGFVERSASYRNTSEDRTLNRIYTWNDSVNNMMPEDMAEDSNHNLNESTKRSDAAGNAVYLHYPDNQSTVIIKKEVTGEGLGIRNNTGTADSAGNKASTQADKEYLTLQVGTVDASNKPKTPTITEFDDYQKAFLKIVPGDLVYYWKYYSINSTNIRIGSHIGEIADVDYEGIHNAKSVEQLLSCITVIECVYSADINHVIKRTMTDKNANDGTAGSNSWMYDDNGNLKMWEIRRLNSPTNGN